MMEGGGGVQNATELNPSWRKRVITGSGGPALLALASLHILRSSFNTDVFSQ
jgi:hypothetical protein